jgi:hypothetical protein
MSAVKSLSGEKKRMASAVAEIDAIELGVSLFEAVVGIRRPKGLTATEAFKTLPDDDQARVIRAAECAMNYCVNAINRMERPS